MKKLFGVALITLCLVTGCASNAMTAIYNNDKKIANTYNLNSVEQTIYDGHFTANVDKMEGMDTIWFLDAKEDKELEMTYTLNVISGKAKLVLINPKGEVSVIEECDSEMTAPIKSNLNIENGENRIKIVADKNTKFDIDVSISEGEFKELG